MAIMFKKRYSLRSNCKYIDIKEKSAKKIQNSKSITKVSYKQKNELRNKTNKTCINFVNESSSTSHMKNNKKIDLQTSAFNYKLSNNFVNKCDTNLAIQDKSLSVDTLNLQKRSKDSTSLLYNTNESEPIGLRRYNLRNRNSRETFFDKKNLDAFLLKKFQLQNCFVQLERIPDNLIINNIIQSTKVLSTDVIKKNKKSNAKQKKLSHVQKQEKASNSQIIYLDNTKRSKNISKKCSIKRPLLTIEEMKMLYSIKECYILLRRLTDQQVNCNHLEGVDIINDSIGQIDLKKSIEEKDYNSEAHFNDNEQDVSCSNLVNYDISHPDKYLCNSIYQNEHNSSDTIPNNKFGQILNNFALNINESTPIKSGINKLVISSNEHINNKSNMNIFVSEDRRTPILDFKVPNLSNTVDSNFITPLNARLENHSYKPLFSLNSSLNRSKKKDLNSILSPDSNNYEMTPYIHKEPSKATQENYNIDNLSFGDSTDDENSPKKKFPKWAMDYFLHECFSLQSIEPPEIFSLLMPQTIDELKKDLDQCFKNCKTYRKYRYR